MRRELLDQDTCPHEDAGHLDDEWTCWDCGGYRDESEAADRRRHRDEQCATCGHGPGSHAPNGGGCYQCPDSGPRWCDTGYRPTGDAS